MAYKITAEVKKGWQEWGGNQINYQIKNDRGGVNKNVRCD